MQAYGAYKLYFLILKLSKNNSFSDLNTCRSIWLLRVGSDKISFELNSVTALPILFVCLSMIWYFPLLIFISGPVTSILRVTTFPFVNQETPHSKKNCGLQLICSSSGCIFSLLVLYTYCFLLQKSWSEQSNLLNPALMKVMIHQSNITTD